MLIGSRWKVLTESLRSMEACGLLTRTVFPEVPPHTEYALTETVRSMKPILDAMFQWGTDYQRTHGTDYAESAPAGPDKVE